LTTVSGTVNIGSTSSSYLGLEEEKLGRKHIGLCRLTGQTGRFVESHILPKSLTRPVAPGVPFVQGGQRLRPVRRWSSWTDKKLVISEGEKILRDLDTWAIPVLRQHRLVWSGWGEASDLPAADHEQIPNTSNGFRSITFADPFRLRLFFLSLLWRAAASDLPEMAEIVMPPDHLDRLTVMVRDGDPYPLGFYPMGLYQLSSRGPTHNHGPIALVMTTPEFDEVPAREFDMFRFYLEGLAIRFYRQASDDGVAGFQDRTCVGSGDPTIVGTVRYEESFQDGNLRQMQHETKRLHRHVLEN